MNQRLRKKCLIASAGVHLLLILILFVGPAFVGEKPPPEQDLPILEFIPFKTTDELVSGGGNPDGGSPPPAAPDPKPQEPPPVEKKSPPPVEKKSPPVKAKESPPVKEVVKETPIPDVAAPVEKKQTRPKINTELVKRDTSKEDQAKKRAEAEARRREQEQVEARRRLASSIGRIAQNLGNSLSASTSIELKGPGGGGIPYANWLQAVKSVYARAWHVPDGITDRNATTVATITVARDGSVVRARISGPSGNAQVDRSVQAALDRVTFAAPLPDTSKEPERTVSINFNALAQSAGI